MSVLELSNVPCSQTCIQALSTIIPSNLIFGYNFDISSHDFRNNPSACFLVDMWGEILSYALNWFIFYFPKQCQQSPISLMTQWKHDSHYVCLVNSCNLAALVFGGVVEGKLGNPMGLFSGDDFHHLNHAWDTLCDQWQGHQMSAQTALLLGQIFIRLKIHTSGCQPRLVSSQLS